MINPAIPLQAAYISLLTGFQVEGINVPVYDSLAPAGATAPYIIITSGETLPDNTKTTWGHRIDVTLDIVTRFGPGPVSSLPVETIVSALLALLFPSPNVYPVAPAGFNLWSCSLRSVQPMTTRTPSDVLVRRIVTVRNQLHPV